MSIELYSEPQNEHDRNLGIGWDATRVREAYQVGNEDYSVVDFEEDEDNDTPFCMRDYFFATQKETVRQITMGAI